MIIGGPWQVPALALAFWQIPILVKAAEAVALDDICLKGALLVKDVERMCPAKEHARGEHEPCGCSIPSTSRVAGASVVPITCAGQKTHSSKQLGPLTSCGAPHACTHPARISAWVGTTSRVTTRQVASSMLSSSGMTSEHRSGSGPPAVRQTF